MKEPQCKLPGRFTGVMFVKNRAAKAFLKNLSEGNIKNLQRQIKRGSVQNIEIQKRESIGT
jgi:hypothetical protein